ncbi:hypothetical protein RB213_007803 [Colletotrichum asianum]
MEDQGLHHQEARVPGESQSQIQDTQTIDPVAYQNNMEDRRRLFQNIQEVDYLVDTDSDRYEKMSEDRFTKEVWALYWVAPYDEVIRARERIRRGQIKSWNMDTFLRNATEMLPMGMYLEPDVMEAHFRELRRIHESQWQQKKREEREARNNSISYLDNISGRQEILEQIQEAEYPDYIPITTSTEFSKLERKHFSKAVWSALWVTPFNSLQDFSRKISRHEIRWFDMHRLFLVITEDLPDVIDIVNNRKHTEHAGVCARKIECLAFLFGKQKIQEYQDALRSGYLESPANLIALDEGVRTMWENDLTVTPADVLFDLTQKPSVLEESSVSDENTTFSGPADMDLVSSATQQHFQDGSTFKVYAEDPKLRPDPILLDLRDKLAVMASLLGAAEYMDDDDGHGNDSEGTRQSAVDEAEDYQSVDGDISDMGEDLYMDDDNYGYDSDE